METVKEYMIYFISALVTIPFVSTYIVYLINKSLSVHQWKAVHQSVQWTNILYISSCMIIVQVLFNRSIFWLIILLHLLMLIGVMIYQWKKQVDISLLHIFKIVWRASFIMFFLSYFLLAIYGILTYSLFL